MTRPSYLSVLWILYIGWGTLYIRCVWALSILEYSQLTVPSNTAARLTWVLICSFKSFISCSSSVWRWLRVSAEVCASIKIILCRVDAVFHRLHSPWVRESMSYTRVEQCNTYFLQTFAYLEPSFNVSLFSVSGFCGDVSRWTPPFLRYISSTLHGFCPAGWRLGGAEKASSLLTLSLRMFWISSIMLSWFCSSWWVIRFNECSLPAQTWDFVIHHARSDWLASASTYISTKDSYLCS